MNENTSYITRRPSQLVNLKYILLTMVMVAVFILLGTVIPRFLEEVPIPENPCRSSEKTTGLSDRHGADPFGLPDRKDQLHAV